MNLKPLLTLTLLILFLTGSNAQWTELGSGVDAPNHIIFGISAASPEVVWAISSAYPTPGDQLVRTTDGGETWEAMPFNIDSALFAIQLFAIDENNAWLATADELDPISGKVYKTSDGGMTWTERSDAFTGFNQTPAAVHFWDANDGVAFGATCADSNNDQIAIYYTEDGGDTWTEVSGNAMPDQLPGESMCLASGEGFYDVVGDTVWFTTYQGRIFKSTDRGKTWEAYTVVPEDLNFLLVSLAFKDEMNGVAGIYPNAVSLTTDGGVSWSAINTMPFFYEVGQMEYIPGTSGSYMAGTGYLDNDSRLCVSYDNGESWELTPTNTDLDCFEFLSPTVGFGGGVVNSPTTGGLYRWEGTPLTSTQEPLADQPIYIAPNPTQSHIRIQMPISSVDRLYTEILDTRGKVVSQSRLSSGEQLDVASLPSGIYWLRVLVEGKVYVGRFVKT